MTLCSTFSSLSKWTWLYLEKARAVSHQLLEETITDHNLVEIKTHHSHDVLTRTYTKPEEAIYGADWQWWFTNSSRNAWFGLRVQAKIINFTSLNYEHLYYKNKNAAKSQVETLISACSGTALFPVYVLYTHWPASEAPFLPKQVVANHYSYGCSIIGARDVRGLKGLRGGRHLRNVIKQARPWECLACGCSSKGGALGKDLPSRARQFIQDFVANRDEKLPDLLAEPPKHILALLQEEAERQESRPSPDGDPELHGVAIFAERG